MSIFSVQLSLLPSHFPTACCVAKYQGEGEQWWPTSRQKCLHPNHVATKTNFCKTIMKVSSVCNSGHGGISATPSIQTLDTVFYGLKLCYGQSHCGGSHLDHVLAMSPCSACALVQTYSQLLGVGGLDKW